MHFTYAAENIIPVTNIDFKPQTGEITYELKVPALIRVRIGIFDGPLYTTIIDWEQKQPGKYTEHWDGMDIGKKLILGGGGEVIATFNYITSDDNAFDPKELIAGFNITVSDAVNRKHVPWDWPGEKGILGTVHVGGQSRLPNGSHQYKVRILGFWHSVGLSLDDVRVGKDIFKKTSQDGKHIRLTGNDGDGHPPVTV